MRCRNSPFTNFNKTSSFIQTYFFVLLFFLKERNRQNQFLPFVHHKITKTLYFFFVFFISHFILSSYFLYLFNKKKINSNNYAQVILIPWLRVDSRLNLIIIFQTFFMLLMNDELLHIIMIKFNMILIVTPIGYSKNQLGNYLNLVFGCYLLSGC